MIIDPQPSAIGGIVSIVLVSSIKKPVKYHKIIYQISTFIFVIASLLFPFFLYEFYDILGTTSRSVIARYNMIDDYVYHLVREFVEINTPGKVYTWGSGGLGHIIVVKRDDTDSSILWQMFGTDYKPLDEDDDCPPQLNT